MGEACEVGAPAGTKVAEALPLVHLGPFERMFLGLVGNTGQYRQQSNAPPYPVVLTCRSGLPRHWSKDQSLGSSPCTCTCSSQRGMSVLSVEATSYAGPYTHRGDSMSVTDDVCLGILPSPRPQ
jgi:hypothetical protein